MNYQDMVSRVLSVKFAGLEMGLAKAREQQSFIQHVAHTLDDTSWDYRVSMDKDFGVTFCVDTGLVSYKHQYQAIKQALSERFEVDFTVDNLSATLQVSCRRTGYGCRVMFGSAE